MGQNAQYLTVFNSIQHFFTLVVACKTNRLTRFDPISVSNTETIVEFFLSNFFQSNNLGKLTTHPSISKCLMTFYLPSKINITSKRRPQTNLVVIWNKGRGDQTHCLNHKINHINCNNKSQYLMFKKWKIKWNYQCYIMQFLL